MTVFKLKVGKCVSLYLTKVDSGSVYGNYIHMENPQGGFLI